MAVPGTVIQGHLSASSLPSRSPLLTQCDGCLEDCVGARSLVTEIASHGRVILSRGRLVTVEAPGYPMHPPSEQHDAVVKEYYYIKQSFFEH